MWTNELRTLSTRSWPYTHFSLAPQNVLILASFIVLLVLFLSSQYASQLPYFGTPLQLEGSVVTLKNEKNVSTVISGVISNGQLIPISAAHLSADPDFILTFGEFNQYFSHQNTLFSVFQQDQVVIQFIDGEQRTLRQQQRTLSQLPSIFWILQLFGAISLLTGLAFWAYHRHNVVTLVLAIGGLGFYLMQVSMSVYAAREFAISGDIFRLLLHGNHLGGIVFIFSLAMLLWCYPSPLGKPKYVIPLVAVPLLIWINELQQWIEWPISLFYFPTLFLLTFTGILLRCQWRKIHSNPQQRTQYLWLVYSILIGMGLTLLAYVIPIVVLGHPLVSNWLANAFCLLVYFGFLLGVHYGGLFSVERWWIKACANVLLAILLIAMDLFAVTLFGAEAALGFSVIAIICFWLYLFARTRIATFLSGMEKKNNVLTGLLFENTNLNAIKNDAECSNFSEIALIQSLYSPLALHPTTEVWSKPTLKEKGLKLNLSVTHQGITESYELIGKQHGRKYFTDEDCQCIVNIITHARETEKLYQEREQTLLMERQRIMRDLHDDVASDLLTLTHRLKNPETVNTARKCLKNLRDIVYSIDDQQSRSLLDAAANWRHEISTLVESVDYPLTWTDDKLTLNDELTGAQWLHLSRILRELTVNAIKHSTVERTSSEHTPLPTPGLSIELWSDDRTIGALIINPGVTQAKEQWHAGKGLKSIERRIEELKGNVSWHVSNNQCQVTLSIPR
ncbi:hypothetical protein A9Q99_11355 [Gammaproteobacteria bacterium 45_16_T64]|nr:hypothetical protein A9Q99_11355 [Gammaproteobacteria bacterium 45_16_T64]